MTSQEAMIGRIDFDKIELSMGPGQFDGIAGSEGIISHQGPRQGHGSAAD